MIFTYNQVQELKIDGYINYSSNLLGLDSIDHCFNKPYFTTFPHDVTYQFNSLGYRERNIKLYQKNSIIVIGDSFTVGLGLPKELTYTAQLEKLTSIPVLNFSMNGASNDWMARKLGIILPLFNPTAIIVHYSFSHRRENNELSWADNERTLCDPLPDVQENYTNWLVNHNTIKSLVNHIPTYYSFIPNWHTQQINFTDNLVPVQQVDYARDFFHYGKTTCLNLAKQYADRIAQQ